MHIQTSIALTKEDIKKIVSDHLKRNGQKLISYTLRGSCTHSWCAPEVKVTVELSEKLKQLKDISQLDES